MSAKSGKKSSLRKNIALGVMTLIIVLATIASFAAGMTGTNKSTSTEATPTPTSTLVPTSTAAPTAQ